MIRSQLAILTGYQELYLAMLDAAQAALMAHGISAPSPVKVPELLKTIKVKTSIIKIFKEAYKTFKKIEHRKTNKITGKKYDAWLKKANKFNKEMEKKLNKKL
jgi:uncharacterized protein (UPF0332 family)